MEKLTVEKLQEFNDVYKAIEYARNILTGYPIRPHKPMLINNANSDQVRVYANLLEKYELDLENYNKLDKEYSKYINQVHGIVVDFIKEESGFNDIPACYQSKVYSYAYDRGHGGGMYEVYQVLVNLVEIFK